MIARGSKAAAEGPIILRWGDALARKRQCCSSDMEQHFHPLSDPHSKNFMELLLYRPKANRCACLYFFDNRFSTGADFLGYMILRFGSRCYFNH
jgi:hypothetical protein